MATAGAGSGTGCRPYIGPRDPVVLQGFYQGNSTFFQPLRDSGLARCRWASGACSFWSFCGQRCAWQRIVRRRWEEEEHLPFPVIVLPLEMTREGAPLYRNPLLWLGFAFPAVLHSLNSLASIYSRGCRRTRSIRRVIWSAGLPFPLNSLSPFVWRHSCLRHRLRLPD